MVSLGSNSFDSTGCRESRGNKHRMASSRATTMIEMKNQLFHVEQFQRHNISGFQKHVSYRCELVFCEIVTCATQFSSTGTWGIVVVVVADNKVSLHCGTPKFHTMYITCFWWGMDGFQMLRTRVENGSLVAHVFLATSSKIPYSVEIPGFRFLTNRSLLTFSLLYFDQITSFRANSRTSNVGPKN